MPMPLHLLVFAALENSVLVASVVVLLPSAFQSFPLSCAVAPLFPIILLDLEMIELSWAWQKIQRAVQSVLTVIQ